MKSGMLGSATLTENRPVYRIITVQFIATIFAAALCLYVDWVAAFSALLGGLTCVVPNFFLAGRLSGGAARQGPALKQLLFGELGKLGLTALMFVATFILVEPLNMLAFFGTFVGLHVFFIVIPLLDKYRQ